MSGFLAAYFARIGYDGGASPTLENIAAVHAHHARAIPFENLSPATGRPVDIDPDAIRSVLVERRRGGYCFQHACLLSRALAEMGAAGVENRLGRVYWGRPPGGGAPPRTHLVTLFEHSGGRVLADAGFGGFNPSGLIPLGTERTTPLGSFRTVGAAESGLPSGDALGVDLMLQARIQDEWATLYGIDLSPVAPADLAVANWYVSTSSATPFTRSLMFSILTETERVTLFNLTLSVRSYAADGSSDAVRRTLGSAAELREVAQDLFRIDDPAVDWDAAFRVAAGA